MGYKTLKDNNFTNPHILLGLRGCLLALFAAFVLTACGGGGGAVAPVTTPPVVGNCPTDPFGATCGDEYAAARTQKINECLIEDMATEDTSCASAVAAQSCLTDPFAAGCDGDEGFSAFLEVAKNERESFCNIDDNAKDTLCVGAVATFCGDNPFYRLCKAKSYTDQQGEIVADCITEGKASEPTCANAVEFNPCIRNPFTPECVTQTDARIMREAFCRKDDNATNALCAGALAHFCELDPFDAICDATAYSRQQMERVDFCISEDNASNNTLCANAVAQDACIRDPFTVTCSTQNVARSIRESFCRQGANAADNTALCGNAVVNICTNDPFDAICNPAIYGTERIGRVAECITGDNASDAPLCANAISQNACISTPYAAGCTGETDARDARETFCRDGNPSNPLCAGAVLHFCDTNTRAEANPFDAELCFANTAYNNTRDTIIMGCITADDTRLEHGDCTNAVDANPCIRTPFDRNCVSDFAPYYQDARDKRRTFCVGLAHNNNPLCGGAIAADPCFNNPFIRNLNDGSESCNDDFAARREGEINRCIARDAGQGFDCINVLAGIGGCLANPFQKSCEDAGNLYFKDYADDARAARVAFCEVDNSDVIRDHDYCFGRTFNYDICVYDPYSRFCTTEFFVDGGLNTTVEAQRTQKVVFCSGDDNEDHGSCAHVRDLVTAATWAHGFDNPLNTSPTSGTNEFLRADSASELDKGSTGATGTNLNLATSTFDYNQFGGDATDGVEFFAGSGNYYAGILGGADLGKPLSGDARVVKWNGRISSTMSIGTTNSDGSTISDAGGAIVATDFTLTINFNGNRNGGTLTSFAKVFLDETANNHYYDIDGTFNADGLITSGTVVYAQFTGGNQGSKVTSAITDATLSGIIGKDGALGVFQGADFAGGFVVHPTIKARVEISDWVRGFGDTPPATTHPTGNSFLQEVSGELTLAPITITAGGAVTTEFEFVTLNTVTEGEQDFVNDVSWFSGYYTTTQWHYATVSDTAYLGEPLSEAPTSGIWYGKFGARANKTDFALTITYSTSERKISAFVRESVGVYYLLAGDFNSAGVITNGTVNYGAFTNGMRTDTDAITRGTNGTLTGLIGQGGALGAFHSTYRGVTGYSGGFWAAPAGVADDEVMPFTLDVDYDDYLRSFLSLEDAPTAQNQFLAISSGISTTGTTATDEGGGDPMVSVLDFNVMNFDGVALGLINTANRVDWFSGYISMTQYHYAGVGRANLGAPLTTTPTGGKWRGIIGVGEHTTDFTLTITYGTAGGTLSAFVRDTPNVYYLLDGGFDANGLIDGTVRYGEFTNRDKTAPVGSTEDGVLTGLIGTDGALGVFHSTVTGGTGYSGGFVARPGAPTYDTEVKYSDYRRSFLTLDTPDTTTPKNQFVTDRAGVMTESSGGTPATENTLALDTTTFDGLALGGAAGNSLFWFNGFAGSSTRTYYAGLDARADLGAPITTSGNWRGVFAVGNAKTDFTLEITYGTNGGTIAAFIRELENTYYLLAGDFDANGLITGTVNYSEFTFTDGERTARNATPFATASGTLTGLIGVEGAVGAFYSDSIRDEKYSGGFVARDGVAAFVPSTVRHATWARGFLLDDTPDTTNPRNQFLRAKKTDGRLDTANRDTSELGLVNLNTARFNDAIIGGNGNGNNRYEAFDRYINGDWYIYTGILPDTDLGTPVVDGSTELTWYGNFTSGEADENPISSTDFVLNITINGTAGGTLSARANYRNIDYYVLAGKFDANGLITGTVAFNEGDFDTTANGILTGIIGVDGAIGVFIGTRGEHDYYGGGFVARPKAVDFTDSVKYSDWLARENPDANPSAESEFLQTTGKTVNTGTATNLTAQFTLDLGTAEFDGAPIFGDANDGFVGFAGTISSTSYAYVGIYESTDLGAPLTQSATWNGVIGFNGVEESTTFTITYDGNIGTIITEDIFIRNFGILSILGTFDDLGLITGAVFYFDDGLAPQGGVLSGLIGADGAVGVFHNTAELCEHLCSEIFTFSGGFIANKDIRQQANWNDWQNSFLVADGAVLNSIPDTLVKRNQFLYGDTGILSALNISHTSSITTTGFTLGLNDGTLTGEATYGGERLGGNGVGGIKYWHGFQLQEESRLHYAQINNDTKLGPIIDEVIGTATYNGQFLADFGGGSDGGGKTTNTDFTLTVTFGGNTHGGAGDIDAFVAESGSTGLHYRLFGSYDTDGVITGNVQYGTFNDNNNPLMWVAEGGRTGLLSGLISQDNALGVFVSSLKGSDGFVGGFVARRTASAGYQVIDEVDDFEDSVTYNDWNRIVNPVTTPSGTRSQFLQTNGRVISKGTLTPLGSIRTLDFATAEFEGAPALTDGDAGDGFSYFTANSLAYSGIFSTTDLGAPLMETTSPTLTWLGQLNFLNVTHDFSLNIAFNSSGGGGKIDGFVEGVFNFSRDLLLKGDFDANGVITGTTNYAEYTGNVPGGAMTGTPRPGILSGLIGQEGAVGVFNSTSSSLAYAGGFVVHPDVIIRTTFSDWAGRAGNPKTTVIDSAGTGTLPLLNGAASVGNTNPDGNFVQGLALSAVADKGFDFTGTPFASASVNGGVLLLEADSPSGVAFSNVTGGNVTGRKGYAGLLSGTNLGAPITDITTSAIWDAKFAAVFVDSSAVFRYSPTDFKMRVTFNNSGGTINSGTVSNSGRFTPGRIVVPYTDGGSGGSTGFDIRGKFGSDGLLYGTVGGLAASAPLTGLIGVDGAVGAFVFGINNFRLVGGFIAKPPVVIPPDANPSIVNYADWTRAGTVIDSAGTGRLPLLNGAARVDDTNPIGNFVQGLPTVDNKGFNFAGTDFASATVRGDILLLEADSPSGVAFSTVLGTGVTGRKGYAGLLPGTNLGAPITDPSTSAIWDAKLQAIRLDSNNVIFQYSNPNFKMQVTFDGSAGTINSGTVSNSGVFTAGNISAPGTPFGSTDYNIRGQFGSDGLLYGEVVLNRSLNRSDGTLTGLIGQDGAVGVFVDGSTGFVGGFVAKPQ